MSYGDLKTRLKAIINRKDLTDTLAGMFITDAIAEIERTARVGPMEIVLTQYTWDGVSNVVVVPGNFLELVNLFTDSGELSQLDLHNFLQEGASETTPTVFVKIANKWLLRPTPSPGTSVYLHYYASSAPLVDDADQNIWTLAAPLAVTYTAASLAADWFQMEDQHVARYSSKAAGYLAAIAEQDLAEKWAGRMAIPLPQNIGEY